MMVHAQAVGQHPKLHLLPQIGDGHPTDIVLQLHLVDSSEASTKVNAAEYLIGTTHIRRFGWSILFGRAAQRLSCF